MLIFLSKNKNRKAASSDASLTHFYLKTGSANRNKNWMNGCGRKTALKPEGDWQSYYIFLQNILVSETSSYADTGLWLLVVRNQSHSNDRGAVHLLLVSNIFWISRTVYGIAMELFSRLHITKSYPTTAVLVTALFWRFPENDCRTDLAFCRRW